MTLVIIPARMGSTRLPGKPLRKIGDKTIIERCAAIAQKARGKVVVATDHELVEECLYTASDVEVVMTGDCATGTDRVAEAAELADPQENHFLVINYQGDMPFLDPKILSNFIHEREKSNADILTAFSTEKLVRMFHDPVRFERTSVKSHIGLYGFKRDALRRFAALKQTPLEKELSLEQCRAMSDDFTWATIEFPSMPIEINTQADLDRARSCLM